MAHASHLVLVAAHQRFKDLVSAYNNGTLTERDFLNSDWDKAHPGTDSMDLVDLYGYKEMRNRLDGLLLEAWRPLMSTERIRTEVIYSPVFVEKFFSLVWRILRISGLATQNLHTILPTIVSTIQGITRDNYLIINCPNPTKYYCGRAMITIERGLARLVIFDTVPPDDMNPVTIERYRGLEDSATYQEVGTGPGMCATAGLAGAANRLKNELPKLKAALPYVSSIQYSSSNSSSNSVTGNDPSKLKVTTNCGCHIIMDIPCDKYPFSGPMNIYVNDISYATEEGGRDWMPTMRLATVIDSLHQQACKDGTCRTFSLDGTQLP